MLIEFLWGQSDLYINLHNIKLIFFFIREAVHYTRLRANATDPRFASLHCVCMESVCNIAARVRRLLSKHELLD